MKVFISWSGRRSRLVAELMSDWIKCVLQASRPWISTRDIDRGSIWFTEISDQLRDTAVGIVCLTQENKLKPWILFEAGALAKGLSTSRVCTFLIDLMPSDIEDPLAQFNHTLPEKESMWELVRSLNSTLDLAALDERILSQVFDTYWPQFRGKFQEALDQSPNQGPVEPRSDTSILEEILSNTRALTTRVGRLENQTNDGFFFTPASSRVGAQLRNLVTSGAPLEVITEFSQKNGLPLSLVEREIRKFRPDVTILSPDGVPPPAS
ncbi:toll/interleukin-1 receptor domain-containing protein [Pseudomonas tohonis]|uniref:toll/interleukin-1 receptor domain-containing protein n=1 Tax=Pseudomonas sp. zfem005 TaxID=3078200 RepID=UPI0003FDB650|nr:toll/interleukin-1 receptor domain-containing protein [Pseudomonas sp. zfem005]MDN4145999.1 toll/interleukin-1 receptor domain-containing protein [Pseudomonas tohonis]MDU9415333.1 toll/interleukin-1 receptor domain-containing protein [Pseudomonas sp. zfem005]